MSYNNATPTPLLSFVKAIIQTLRKSAGIMADDDAVAAYLARERAALGKLTNSYFAYTGCIPKLS
jgi:hypothetical protein